MSQHSPFKIDTVEQCLWRIDGAGGEERLHLAPKAFQVFHYLLSHSGRIVSHDEVLQAVWPTVHVQPEILKSHILAIRGVLGDRADTSMYIETVRGRGYRFVGPIAHFYPEPLDDAPHADGVPFVGRKAPLLQLAAQFASAASGEFQATLITGEPDTHLGHSIARGPIFQPPRCTPSALPAYIAGPVAVHKLPLFAQAGPVEAC